MSMEEKKKLYIEEVYAEMKKRGFTSAEIPMVINKTGFMDAIDLYSEEQWHYDISDAVDEIITLAAKK